MILIPSSSNSAEPLKPQQPQPPPIVIDSSLISNDDSVPMIDSSPDSAITQMDQDPAQENVSTASETKSQTEPTIAAAAVTPALPPPPPTKPPPPAPISEKFTIVFIKPLNQKSRPNGPPSLLQQPNNFEKAKELSSSSANVGSGQSMSALSTVGIPTPPPPPPPPLPPTPTKQLAVTTVNVVDAKQSSSESLRSISSTLTTNSSQSASAIATITEGIESNSNNNNNNNNNSSLINRTISTPAPKMSKSARRRSRKSKANRRHNLQFEKSIFQMLSKSLQSIDCKLEKVIFKNDYIIKFNGNFTIEDFNYRNFLSFLKQLWQEVNRSIFFSSEALAIIQNDNGVNDDNGDQFSCWSSKIIIEFPLNFMMKMFRLLFTNHDMLYTPYLWSNYERIDIANVHLGSLINLSKYLSHFSVADHCLPISNNVNNGKQQTKFSQQTMKLEIKYLKKSICIYFHLDSKRRLFKLLISFSSIKTILIEQLSDMRCLFLDLFYSPLLFYVDLDDIQLKMLEMDCVCDLNLVWRRTINLQNHHQRQRSNEFDPNLFGLAKSLCIEFPINNSGGVGSSNGPNSNNIGNQLFGKLLYIANTCKSLNKNFNFYLANVDLCNSAIHYGSVKNLLLTKRLPFSTYYACLTLFSTSYKIADELKENNLLNDFIDVIELESKIDKSLVEQTLYLLKIQYKEHCMCNIYAEFVKLITDEKAYLDGKGLVHNDFVLIRKAVITPSHLELFPPVPLLKSRFSNIANVEYSIRVTVLDDNNQRLNNLKRNFDLEFILNNIKPKLLDGLSIGDRCYEFLGSSSSQMRENGVIFYSKDDQDRTAQSIRNMAGDLSNFNHDVAKYVSRFGLMFSQAMGHFHVNDSEIRIIMTDDFIGDVKPNFLNYVNFKKEQHIFSDGVGVISEQVAEKIIESLQLKSNDFPSAFQIRYGGCKGMLVVYKTHEPMIIFRKSMCKYNSHDNSLGILKFSAPRPVFLNRPLINILDQMRVEPQVFYSFFDQSTAMVAKASLYDNWALELIKTYSTSYLPYDHIYNCGISLLTEPFFRAIINYLIYYRLNELKCKARIRIPYTNGRIVFGVVDESKELNYGEVFFQYTKMSADGHPTGETVIMEGEVMVTKFPCLQPGDVRKLRAVSDPERIGRLVHIKDCIVFPSRGQRPHPDEMGGSDLDGDEYAVFWHTGLIFPCANFEPMQFPYGIGKRQNDSITIDDIVDFYCNYLLYNNIGRVANCHLMFSDVHPKGLFSRQCHSLAIQYSIALDFQKTGFYNMLSRQYQMSIRPDFMERFSTSRIYLSKRILGQFYRHCCLIEKVIDLSQFDQFLAPSIVTETPNVNTKSLPDTNNEQMIKNQRFVLRDWKKFEAEAEEAFLEYKLRIIELLEQLDIENEIVLLCDVYEDKSDVSKVLILGLFKYFRTKFDHQAARLKTREDRLLLISAWYSIVFEKCFMYNGKQLLGLPWLISEEMCHLASELDRSNVKSNLVILADGDASPVFRHNNLPSDDNDSDDNSDDNSDDSENEKATPGPDIPPPSAMDYDFSRFFNKEVRPNQLTITEPEEFDIIVQQSYQFKIALQLIIEWIRLIRLKIYRCSVARQFCFLLEPNNNNRNGNGTVSTDSIAPPTPPDSANSSPVKPTNNNTNSSNNNRILLNYSTNLTSEDDIFEKYFNKFFKIEIDKLKSTSSQELLRSKSTGQPVAITLPSVSFLFNICLAHLFELCNLSNQLILNGDLEKIFLLKYAVFGLSFMNKFDENLDRQFGKVQKEFDAEQQLQFYIGHLKSLFEKFPTNQDFSKENNRFYLLIQNSLPFDIYKEEPMVREKLCYLSGVESIKFSKEKNDIIVDEGGGNDNCSAPGEFDSSEYNNNNNNNNSSSSNKSRTIVADHIHSDTFDQAELAMIQMIIPYQVRTIGMTHSISILRLLLGHPGFVDNIFDKFVLDRTQCSAMVNNGTSNGSNHQVSNKQQGLSHHHHNHHHHNSNKQQLHGAKNHHLHHNGINNNKPSSHHNIGLSSNGGGGGAIQRRFSTNRKNFKGKKF